MDEALTDVPMNPKVYGVDVAAFVDSTQANLKASEWKETVERFLECLPLGAEHFYDPEVVKDVRLRL